MSQLLIDDKIGEGAPIICSWLPAYIKIVPTPESGWDHRKHAGLDHHYHPW